MSKYEENELIGSLNKNSYCSEGQNSLDIGPLGPSFYNGKISYRVLDDKNYVCTFFRVILYHVLLCYFLSYLVVG